MEYFDSVINIYLKAHNADSSIPKFIIWHDTFEYNRTRDFSWKVVVQFWRIKSISANIWISQYGFSTEENQKGRRNYMLEQRAIQC